MVRKVASGIVLTLLIFSMLLLVFNIQTATIYSKLDGIVGLPTMPILTVDNITYTFAADFYDSVVVKGKYCG